METGKTYLRWADTQAEIILVKSSQSHLQQPNQQALQRRFGIMWKYLCKDQIYTHLKAYEPHAKKTLKKQEQSTSIVDPLAYVAHTTSAPALSSPSTLVLTTVSSSNEQWMAIMTQIANLLSGFQKQFPPTNNQLRTSSNSRTHATVHDGHIVTEPVQRKAPGNNGNTGTRGKKVICYNCRGEGHVAR
ncbi:hypothetical protein Tco_1005340 [Tanacetum coccineum]|uniref:CCHC-type domain-containing protein n=1 Tax=Tanacetum coccineum TaxID=301880 RepID=A0ABQ5FGX4_9ASTR